MITFAVLAKKSVKILPEMQWFREFLMGGCRALSLMLFSLCLSLSLSPFLVYLSLSLSPSTFSLYLSASVFTLLGGSRDRRDYHVIVGMIGTLTGTAGVSKTAVPWYGDGREAARSSQSSWKSVGYF